MGATARNVLGLIGVLVVFLSLAPIFTFNVAASLPSARIMPLGDSITVGYPGAEGYRKILYQGLEDSGFIVNFVGSQKNGTAFDTDHEGHLGYEANQISDNIIGWLNATSPDVVLLHTGTNDIDKGQTASDVTDEVSSILDKIDSWESSHNSVVVVVLARIILRSNETIKNQTTMAFNNDLQQMALNRISSKGDKIVVVDMENALDYSTDLVDHLHPTSGGYSKMADVWLSALSNILGYTLSLNHVGNGQVTVNPQGSVYAYGTSVNLTAVADEGWTFSGWSDALTGSTNPAQITIDNNKTVTATFTQIQYMLTVSTNLGTTNPPTGDNSYPSGTIVTVEAVPPTSNTGVQYVCLGWTGTGSVPASGSGSNVTFTINAPSTIVWTWKTQYLLTVSSDYGTVSGGGWFDAGTPAYASVNPTSVTSSGIEYLFSQWSSDASGSYSTSNAIIMDGPKTATATWSPKPAATPTPTATPQPTPNVTPKPTIKPTPTPTVTPTSSPTATPSSTATVSPSASPTQAPGDGTGSNIYLYLAAFGVISVGAVIGVVGFRRVRKQAPTA